MMKKLVAYSHICAVLACVGYGAKLFLDGDSLDTEYWLMLVMLVALLSWTWELLQETVAEQAEV
jgi:hypothetical protein